MDPKTIKTIIEISYILAAVFFIFGLKMLGSQKTARKGNLISSVGMLLAIVATLLNQGLKFEWIAIGFGAGALIGALAAFLVKMTSMPEMVALFNGFGGIASLLVAWWEYLEKYQGNTQLTSAPLGEWIVPVVAIGFAVFIGGVTFTGSLVAYAKLAERIPTQPYLFPGQVPLNLLLLLVSLGLIGLFSYNPAEGNLYFYALLALSFLFGILGTIPIGGADMPVAIALLNSYSGLAACAAGFVLTNTVLIVSGSLVGASGIILTNIMCKAMNRKLINVLIAGDLGGAKLTKKIEGEAKPISPQDAYYIIEAARSVIFVPGYGMAVAQAQHVVKELGKILEDNGAEVKYVVHPVAGRMPGHMNVLLAEADVPYEQLVVPEDVNPIMESIDVAIVVGANDVVNPAARTDKGSALYGMPIIDVDKAKTVIVLKRSLRPGFAGVDNPLFFNENTRMLLGDAKSSIQALINEFKD
ncbi:MAG: NAD(P)(+) transhydrogenase (Re/Si-specific) subunit beta [Planctomycetota bacterium]|nr:MAG: NAD(P)(+) transhydrogenase (Re/Si-specific) subunit beta [Planctomycetota bacterium]